MWGISGMNVYVGESGGPEASNPRLRRYAWGLAILTGEANMQFGDDREDGGPSASGAGTGARMKPDVVPRAGVAEACDTVSDTPLTLPLMTKADKTVDGVFEYDEFRVLLEGVCEIDDGAKSRQLQMMLMKLDLSG